MPQPLLQSQGQQASQPLFLHQQGQHHPGMGGGIQQQQQLGAGMGGRQGPYDMALALQQQEQYAAYSQPGSGEQYREKL